MRGIRFRDGLTAYLVGLAVIHLRLLSTWSITAARLHFWLTEERGEMPTPLESYRTTETALKVYADSLSEDNDRLRHAVRLGIVGMIAEIVRDVGERVRAFGDRTKQVLWDLTRGTALAIATMWGATFAAGLLMLGVDAIDDMASLPAAEGPPDAGVPRRTSRLDCRVLEMCYADRPHYVLRWTHYERAPRLIVFAETRYYAPLVYPTQPFDALRDCGGEIFPRPEEIAWNGGEVLADPMVIELD